MNNVARQLRQCYSCTAHLHGCGEFLDPRYVARYIRPCPSSCIIFRNPNDHNRRFLRRLWMCALLICLVYLVITRDCSASWPQVHAKSGLHKLLGSDAFFCQESLYETSPFLDHGGKTCLFSFSSDAMALVLISSWVRKDSFLSSTLKNDVFLPIVGIFHNQLPAVVTFPPTQTVEETSSTIIPIATTSILIDDPTTAIVDENTIWEEEEEEEEEDDFVMVETTTIKAATTVVTTTTTTKTMNKTTSSFVSTTLSDDFDPIDEPFTPPVEHFELIGNIPASSTISGGMAVAQDDSELNWWDMSDSFTEPLPEPRPALTTTTKFVTHEDQLWDIFNTTTVPIPSITRFEPLSVDVDVDDFESPSEVPDDPSHSEVEVDVDMNDYFLLSTAVTGDLGHPNDSFVPYYFNDYKPKDEQKELLNLIKPIPTLAMPPFSWMLHQANQTKHGLKTSTLPITTTTTKKKRQAKGKMSNTPKKQSCHGKQCQHGGHLNGDCLCICLPAFTGEHCQTGTAEIFENELYTRSSPFPSSLRSAAETCLWFSARSWMQKWLCSLLVSPILSNGYLLFACNVSRQQWQLECYLILRIRFSRIQFSCQGERLALAFASRERKCFLISRRDDITCWLEMLCAFEARFDVVVWAYTKSLSSRDIFITFRVSRIHMPTVMSTWCASDDKRRRRKAWVTSFSSAGGLVKKWERERE